MEIKRIKKSEIGSAAKIVGINYSKDYEKRSRRELGAAFRDGIYKPKYFTAHENGKIVGFASYINSWMDYNFHEIFWVNVLPQHQGKGIGSALVKKLISEIRKEKESKFVIITTKKPAFYKKLGFTKLYKTGKEDECMMILDLNKK